MFIVKIFHNNSWHYLEANKIEVSSDASIEATNDGKFKDQYGNDCTFSYVFVEYSETCNPIYCKYLVIKDEKDNDIYVVYNMNAYLLSDSGKTIDKL